MIPTAKLSELGFAKLSFQASVMGDSLGTMPKLLGAATDGAEGLLARLWKNADFTDVVVATDTGKQINCHRAVLSSASSVFERMLKSDFKEGLSASVIVRDAEEADLRCFLEYIYTNQLRTDGNVSKMMQLADMYDLPCLALRCGRRMLDSLAPENVKSVMRALRKRGRSEDLDDIFKRAKRKVQASEAMVDALIAED